MTDWAAIHAGTVAALRARAEHWSRAFLSGPPHERRAVAVRSKFFEAFFCWLEARRVEAKAKGEPRPEAAMELRAFIGTHVTEFAEPLDEGGL